MAAPEPMAADELAAAFGLAGLAAGFVTQPETYPVFLAWVAKEAESAGREGLGWPRAMAQHLAEEFLLSAEHLIKVIDAASGGAG
jgi:hypothetical protein